MLYLIIPFDSCHNQVYAGEIYKRYSVRVFRTTNNPILKVTLLQCRKMRHIRLRHMRLCTLALVSTVSLAFLFIQKNTRPRQTFRNATSIIQRCYILTLNASLQPLRVAPGLLCRPFLGTPFNQRQFAMLSATTQQKLKYPSLQMLASELTNNNSVSIFFNHAQIWSLVQGQRNPVLILEDDAIIKSESVPLLNDLASTLAAGGKSVIKVGETPHALPLVFRFLILPLALLEWRSVFSMQEHSVYQCVCRPWFQTSNSAAYIVTPAAAQVLLRYHLPMQEHVDVYMHKQGCVFSNLDFFLVNPPITLLSHRASVHNHEQSWWQRQRLLLLETWQNLRQDTC